ncbi:MAG: putative DNA binding domain-containing protein [Bacteroidetes bacterium]|nr:putative DNA binding domain-containing protein [Bacteroidota bacterium]
MFNNQEELLQQIQLGENSLFELKSLKFRGNQVVGPSRDKLANEIAAMANSNNGVILLGVDDKTREITGIPPEYLETVDRYIHEICNDSITPPVRYTFFHIKLPDTTGTMRVVFKIEIPRSIFIHRSPEGYFFRQGSSVREMSPEFLARMFQQRSQARIIRFEEQPVSGSSVDDLSKDLWQRYTTRSDELTDVVLLKRSLLATHENKSITASVAGVLFCSKNPEIFFPNAFIEAVRYRGERQNSNFQIDAKRIRGPLDQQIEDTVTFFRKNQTVGAEKRPYRVEKPQFSDLAVFEAIVNAVAHRDYSIHGSKIRFFMFDDRLEIYSPGSLPNTITVDSIHLRQSTRNELMTSLLAETPVAQSIGDVGRAYYMDKRGDGVRIIMDESNRLSGKKPVYQLIDDSELLLTIYSAKTS